MRLEFVKRMIGSTIILNNTTIVSIILLVSVPGILAFSEEYSRLIRWYFVIFASECGVGIVLNSLLLYAILPLKCYDQSVYAFNIILTASNLVLSVEIFIRNVISVQHGHMVTYPLGPPCMLITAVEIFHIFLNTSLVVALSFIAKLYLCNGVRLSIPWLSLIIGIGIVCSSILAIIVAVYTKGGFGDDSSHTYCAYESSCTRCHLYLDAYVVILFSFLLYNAYHVRHAFQASQQLLDSIGIQGQAKRQYIFMAKTLGIFTLLLLNSESLFIGGKLYEATTGDNIPHYISVLSAVFMISGPTIVFPSLFIIRNEDAKERLMDLYKCISRRLINTKESKVHVGIQPITVDAENLDKIDLNSWESWLAYPPLRDAFYEDALRQIATENICFYEDVHKYYQRFVDLEERCSQFTVNYDEISDDWRRINKFANQIYVLYIKVTQSDCILP